MKIGLLQLNPQPAAASLNAEMIFEAVQIAASQGADLCLTSELAVCGYPATDMLTRHAFIESCQDVLRALAERLDKASLPPVVVGAPIPNLSQHGKPLHNAAVLLQNGRLSVITRKVLLPADGAHDDHHYFEPGVACGVLQHGGWRFAVTIGEDVWNDRGFWQSHRAFDHDPVEEFMSGGADALLNLTAVAYSQGSPVLHQKMLAWTATRYRIPVVAVNQASGIDGLVYDGGSMVIDGQGILQERADMFAPDVRVVDLSSNKRPENIRPVPEEEEIWNALLLGVKDFVAKSGFSKVVLGLSGGIDSALVAAVAADALGPENVLGVLMPSPYSSRGSIDDALELARNINIETVTIPIEPMMRSYDGIWSETFKAPMGGLTAENLQPRIRGALLMAISNTEGRMVLTTGNKSEIAVGYCTLYGDTCGGLAVIGDLYKTQVYALCRWLNAAKGKNWIPENILTKEPSAELKPGQKDSDSLPNYDELDAILHGIIEEWKDGAELVRSGFNAENVKHVMRLLKRSEFKRRQLAPSVCISSRPFGNAWRMPQSGGEW